ncbi:MAG: DUF3087 domain-containing protein [Colwellia sp.]|nr:DUF3087 domain-containing protein [Colwellia sp.]MCW9081225.1 DUF3087 domain-containing protein [Colwellia sp.]
MQLINIDKPLYRKNLNIIIGGFIATLLILSLVFGQLLILGFGQEGVSNFKFNLLGVILALLACAAILHSLKTSRFFKEVYYVWQLKQCQNSIFRKLAKIKVAAKNNDSNALIILVFYYQSLKLVYQLDDNTLTLSKVEQELNTLHETITNNNLAISADQFDKSLLTSYS